MRSFTTLILSVFSLGTAHAVSLISLNFSGALSDVQRQTFMDARDFWNSTITGYDLTIGYTPTNEPYFNRPHSLAITVSLPAIDGVNGVLGSAGFERADYYDDNAFGAPTVALYYTTTGAMEFDVADVDAMVSANTFYGVVLHEMAHVLGIGSLWTYNTNLAGTTYNLYTTDSGQYFGSKALNEWRSEFSQPGAAFVPVELGGGPNTANGHWNEVDGGAGNTGFVSNSTGLDMENELMTGWASSTFFISRTTLGTLDDLGYIVDYTKAGVVNHTPVPESSALIFSLVAAGMVLRRRR